MSTATVPTQSAEMTAEEFLARHGDERGIELVRGIVRRKPMPGIFHGQVSGNLATDLGIYLRKTQFGRLLTNDTLVRTEQYPPSFRGPDLQVISYSRLPKDQKPAGVADVSPELVVEVRSPSNSWRELIRKAVEYLDADVKVVILIDPEKQTASIYRSNDNVQSIGVNDVLAIPDLLPGFEVPMTALFE